VEQNEPEPLSHLCCKKHFDILNPDVGFEKVAKPLLLCLVTYEFKVPFINILLVFIMIITPTYLL